MTTVTKATLAARVAELEAALAAKPAAETAGFVAIWRNNVRRTEDTPLGYAIIDIPEGVRKVRVAVWKPDRERINSRGERALLTGQVTAVRTPGRVTEPAEPADEAPFDDDIGF